MSAARIKCVLDLDPMDFTYTIVEDTIFGGLEIELGIINACLPILRPLFGKMFAATSGLTSVWSKKTDLDSSDRQQIWSKQKSQADSKDFRLLKNDHYPLNNMTSSNVEFDSEGNREQYPGKITVTQYVDVYTSSTNV